MSRSCTGKLLGAIAVVAWVALLAPAAVQAKASGKGFHNLPGSRGNAIIERGALIKNHGSHAFIRQPMADSGLASHAAKRASQGVQARLQRAGAGISTARATQTFAVPRNGLDTNVREREAAAGPMALGAVTPTRTGLPSYGNVGGVPAAGGQGTAVATLKSALKSLSMLSLWYAGTVMYNIENKKALNMCPLPKTIAALQMLVGIPFFLTRWLVGLKPVPSLYVSNAGVQEDQPRSGVLEYIKRKVNNGLCRVRNTIQAYATVLKQSAVFSMLHLLSVTALGAGAISFVHIVKASEPLFVSALSLISGTGGMSPVTFLTLLPILGGVAMASMKDVNFSPVALTAALASNIFASIRRIEAKKFFRQDLTRVGQHLDASNVSSLVTIFSSLFLAPLALLEYPQWAYMYKSILYKFSNKGLLQLAGHIALSGFFYTLYNEVSFIALSQLAPVSHAVANTLKRIFLILTSSILFKTKLTDMGLYGSATAVTGALLYSLSKHYMG